MSSLKQTYLQGSISSLQTNIDNKKQRKPFRMVRSTFQAPEETQPSYNYSDKIKSHSSVNNKSNKKALQKQSYEDEYNISPYYVNSDQTSEMNTRQFHANIQFIKSIRPIKQYTNFQEGDCFPLDTDDRWLIISGEVKVMGINGLSFNRKAGFIFFASPQTKSRVKQVIAVSSTISHKLSRQFFRDYIRNFLYVKNAQKIKYMKYSPFLVWNQSIAQDLAICMQLLDDLPKDYEIYKSGAQAQDIYFVKQGIILLQRIGKPGNPVIQNYQKHYQSSQLNQDESLLIVRKGMIFGVDGILIKQKNDQINLMQDEDQQQQQQFQQQQKQQQYEPKTIKKYSEQSQQDKINPQQQQQSPSKIHPYKKKKHTFKPTRIYTAKAIGKCQIYKLNKIILQSYFKMSQYLSQHPQQLHMSKQQLQRICKQYTNLIMGNNNTLTHVLKKKQFQFRYEQNQAVKAEEIKKKKKVQEIKQHQRKLKKISLNANNIHHNQEQKSKPAAPQYQPIFNIVRTRKSLKKKTMNISNSNKQMKKQVSLPSLGNTNKLSLKISQDKKLEGLIMKKIQEKQSRQYMTYKKKVEKSLLARETQEQISQAHTPNIKKSQQKQQKVFNLQCMKVKSYKSILTSLS